MSMKPFVMKKKNKAKKNRVQLTTKALLTELSLKFKTQDRVRINDKWMLQIRGKHLRRLKKKLLVRQVGRYLQKKIHENK